MLASESLTELFFKDSFLYQSWKKVPWLWFQRFSCRFICLSTKEKEQCWEKGKNLSSEKQEPGEAKGHGVKGIPCTQTAAWPAFFQGSATNKAAAGSPVLLFLAICCLFWLLYCPVPALSVPAGLELSSKGMLWLWHAGDCLGPAQLKNATSGASQIFSKVARSCCDYNPWLWTGGH